MARLGRWIRLAALAAMSAVAVVAVGLLPMSFLSPYHRHVMATAYRPINDAEIQRIAAAHPTSQELADFAESSSAERAGRIAATQTWLTKIQIANGGVSFFADTWPGWSFGAAYEEAGSPMNAQVTEMIVARGGSYPHLFSPRVGWSWCGVTWGTRPPYARTDGREGHWIIVLPLPLVALLAGAWPAASLLGAQRRRRARGLPGFSPLLAQPTADAAPAP